MTTLTISGADGAGRRDRCHGCLHLLGAESCEAAWILMQEEHVQQPGVIEARWRAPATSPSAGSCCDVWPSLNARLTKAVDGFRAIIPG